MLNRRTTLHRIVVVAWLGIGLGWAPRASAQSSGTEPSLSPVQSAPSSGDLSVQLTSPQPGLALHRADGWELLCEAPCTLELAPGEHRLALSLGGREPVPAAPLSLQREGTLIGRYVDREDQRIAGWITIAAGVIAAASAAIYSQLQWNDVTGFPDDQLGTIAAVLISGASILVITEIIGWILVAQGDGAELSFD